VAPARRAFLHQMMERQLAVLQRLVDDLLDLTRITHGQIKLKEKCIDLGEFLQDAASAAGSYVASRGHELVLRLPSEQVDFMADGVRLDQVVANLLDNAAKYTDRGGRIELSGAREGSEVVIRCKDNGRGIPWGMKQMIFEPFTRTEKAGESAVAGVGVGLALVKHLVELHGGEVFAESGGPGAGSEFVVRLPLVEPPPATPGGRRAGSARDSRSPLSVAVVEDNPDVAQSLAILLERAGHRVTVFEDGPSALSGLARLKPAAVVLDIGLPGLDGYELAAGLRKDPTLKHTLLIALSGFKDREEPGNAQGCFDHYLVKPVDPAKLLACLETRARAAAAG
jgi:CheY-like chemotaxis protein/two-component sensor histidine kinase